MQNIRAAKRVFQALHLKPGTEKNKPNKTPSLHLLHVPAPSGVRALGFALPLHGAEAGPAPVAEETFPLSTAFPGELGEWSRLLAWLRGALCGKQGGAGLCPAAHTPGHEGGQADWENVSIQGRLFIVFFF